VTRIAARPTEVTCSVDGAQATPWQASVSNLAPNAAVAVIRPIENTQILKTFTHTKPPEMPSHIAWATASQLKRVKPAGEKLCGAPGTLAFSKLAKTGIYVHPFRRFCG